MEKPVRKLKDFLKSVKKELLNIADFLGTKTFRRNEIPSVIREACEAVDASEIEVLDLTEVLELEDVMKEAQDSNAKQLSFNPEVPIESPVIEEPSGIEMGGSSKRLSAAPFRGSAPDSSGQRAA